MPRLVKRFSFFEKYERYDSKGVSDLKACLDFFVISERSYENLDYPAHEKFTFSQLLPKSAKFLNLRQLYILLYTELHISD